MGNADSPEDQPLEPDTAAERRLRGNALEGAEQRDAVNHAAYEKRRNPDTELRVDGEKDSLYNDGLDIEPEPEPLAGTRGPSSGIKP
ncbi:MAG: hypothetical protein ACLQT5_10745 [Steroidobacteraceae bacterium]|jgi:hypothetical protein